MKALLPADPSAAARFWGSRGWRRGAPGSLPLLEARDIRSGGKRRPAAEAGDGACEEMRHDAPFSGNTRASFARRARAREPTRARSSGSSRARPRRSRAHRFAGHALSLRMRVGERAGSRRSGRIRLAPTRRACFGSPHFGSSYFGELCFGSSFAGAASCAGFGAASALPCGCEASAAPAFFLSSSGCCWKKSVSSSGRT